MTDLDDRSSQSVAWILPTNGYRDAIEDPLIVRIGRGPQPPSITRRKDAPDVNAVSVCSSLPSSEPVYELNAIRNAIKQEMHKRGRRLKSLSSPTALLPELA